MIWTDLFAILGGLNAVVFLFLTITRATEDRPLGLPRRTVARMLLASPIFGWVMVLGWLCLVVKVLFSVTSGVFSEAELTRGTGPVEREQGQLSEPQGGEVSEP